VAEEERTPTPEELSEQIGQLKVSDVLVQTLTMISSLGWQKLAAGDLVQARVAIDAIRAVVPALGDTVPPELVRDLNQVVANMQLAYAKAVTDRAEVAAEPEAAAD
jgi:hypothetical protein